VKLIDAAADQHVWAEKYDGDLEDIFAMQDKITSSIVATLPGRIEAFGWSGAERDQPDNMAAYELMQAGRRLHHNSSSEDNARALDFLARAVEMDPQSAPAHAWRGCTLGQAWVNGWAEDRDATWALALTELEKARGLDNSDSNVLRLLAGMAVAQDDIEVAMHHQEKALQLNPNDDLIVVQQGEVLTWLGRGEEGVEWIKKAMALNPYHPERYWGHLGRAHFVAHQYDEAISCFRRLSVADKVVHAHLAAAMGAAGDAAGAQRHGAEVRRLDPEFTVKGHLATLHYVRSEDEAHHRAALLAAGLPEG
jgi:adenylate cyclase